MPATKEQIDRINEISTLARTAWFSLLGYLVFVGITLLGVRDADFFVPSRQTDLPLVNVAIPTASFFWIAPVLGAALYAYLHLFLIKLWDAHGAARTSDSDATHHWLVGDFVLIRQRDPVARARPLAFLSDWITRLLVWWAGPIVLAFAWWRSMPAHDEWLTLVIAACFWLTVVVGFTSWWRAEARIGQAWPRPGRTWLRRGLAVLLALLLVATSWLRTEGGAERYAGLAIDAYEAVTGHAIFEPGRNPDNSLKPASQVQAEWIAASPLIPNTSWFTFGEEDWPLSIWLRDLDPFTHNTWNPLVRMDFRDERLADLPAAWSECDVARRELRIRYAASVNQKLTEDWPTEVEDAFTREWTRKRAAEKRSIVSADLSSTQLNQSDFTGAVGFGLKLPPLPWPSAKIDFNIFDGSNFFDDATCSIDWSQTNFAGMSIGTRLDAANLANARLDGIDLGGAQMNRANLAKARLGGANLRDARLEAADLEGAVLDGANLALAVLDRANLSGASLVAADLGSASLQGTDLSEVRMDEARLLETKMTGANLHEAHLTDASLALAVLDGANLTGAQLTGATLSQASLLGADLTGANLAGANLTEAHLAGANLTSADLRNTPWTGFAFERQPSPAHDADFRGAQFLNQSRLDEMIGNAGTLLPDGIAPDTGQPYAIWSCWQETPAGLGAMIERHPEYLCAPGSPRVRTGTPLAVDADYPPGHPLAGAD